MLIKKFSIFIIVIIFLFPNLYLSCEGTLNKKILDLIDESVFEVVILKPTVDSLTYEKPLPMDKIPFVIRKDKYYSIGTAFAISKNEFLSASHVFSLDIKTLYKDIFIRDKKGNVYEIDTVLNYDNHRDFIKFTVKNKINSKFLSINLTPDLNDIVFAVGNAYGEGIIIRNGIFTSKTPEDEQGEWDWIRFSAAASPGNSGGPLLDKDGKVIGVVLRKSENENLNYALPMSVINNIKGNYALSHRKLNYSFLILNDKKSVIFDYKVSLPKEYHILKDDFTKSLAKFCSKTFQDLLSENKDILFPNGKVSQEVLHTTYSATFPNVLGQKDDGNWTSFRPDPEKRTKNDLNDNGNVEFGEMGGVGFVYLEKPDNISLKELCENSKLFMDLILKGTVNNREIANEKIRIISMGEAKEQYTFVDKYKRVWLYKSWLMEYNDSKVITYSMVVPEGLISIIMISQIADIDDFYMNDIKELTNFVNLSYYGTFKDWKEFLNLKEYLPEIFKTYDFKYIEGQSAQFNSKRLNFEFKQNIFNITSNSDLKLYLSYFKENGVVNWDVTSIDVGEDKNNSNYFSISKEMQPEKGMQESFFSDWDKIITQKHPYNKTSFVNKDATTIKGLLNKFEKPTSNSIKDYVYTLMINFSGTIDDNKMKQKFNDLDSIIKIVE